MSVREAFRFDTEEEARKAALDSAASWGGWWVVVQGPEGTFGRGVDPFYMGGLVIAKYYVSLTGRTLCHEYSKAVQA